MKNIFRFRLILFLVFNGIILFSFSSCQKEQYRKDRGNKMTKKSKIASDYLANQAVDLTQDNIEKRGQTEKKSRKELIKKQRELNSANETSSKVKKGKKHSGNYKFY